MRSQEEPRPATALLVAALLAASCQLRPPHARLVITDPLGLAAGAATLAVGTSSGALERISLGGAALPLSLVVTMEGDEADARILVEALAPDDRVLGRGGAEVHFKLDQAGASAEIALQKPCEDASTCDDGLFCNGEERCLDRGCVTSPEPCPHSVIECGEVGCDEQARACICTYLGPTEVEPNDSAETATPLVPGSSPQDLRPIRGGLGTASDVDYFAVEVPPGNHLDVSASIPGFDDCVGPDVLTLTLIDVDGVTLLATSGVARSDPTCGKISPATTPKAFGLPGGRYYVVVSPVRQVDTYFLNVRTIAPGCGNGVKDQGEACDDGDRTPDDGCSPSCELEILATLQPPGGSVPMHLFGADVVQIVRVEIARTGQSITATVAQPEGGCASGTGLELLDANGLSLGFVTTRGPFGCTAIDYRQDAFASGLRAGSYYLVVFSAPGTFGRLDVKLDVRVVDPVCGNGFLEVIAGEQCDDGNRVARDGCSATCQFEVSVRFTPPGGFDWLTIPALGFAVAEIEIRAPGQSITATTTTLPFGCAYDSKLTLISPDFVELGSRASVGFQYCSRIFYPAERWARDLAPGRYYLKAESNYSDFDLYIELSVISPRCGDGVTQHRAAEVCDDGNLARADGCDEKCQLEGTAPEEHEPNSAFGQAGALGVGINGRAEVVGRISPAGDIDYFSFEIPLGRTAALVARTYGQRGDRWSCEGDTVLSLLDQSGRMLAENDDIVDVGCSLIDGTGPDRDTAVLSAGTYFLRVRDYSGSRVIPSYVLEVELIGR